MCVTVCAGVIDQHQLTEPMILYSHGGILNPHIVAQLSHFAPVEHCEQMDTIDDARVFDTYTIVQNPDTTEITQRYIASLTDLVTVVSIDVDVILKARAEN